jgi:hypothetical protein
MNIKFSYQKQPLLQSSSHITTISKLHCTTKPAYLQKKKKRRERKNKKTLNRPPAAKHKLLSSIQKPPPILKMTQ